MNKQQMSQTIQEITGFISNQEKPVIVLSDFDGTLCNTYDFDQSTNNHIPKLDPEVAELARNKPLIVATARRTNHPWLPSLWETGVIDPEVPIISENGGTISALDDRGVIRHWFQIDRDEMGDIAEWAEEASHNITDLPAGQKIASKIGKTIVVLRIQDEAGHSELKHQKILHSQLLELNKPDGIAIVNGGGSLTIQSERINKARTFHKILNMLKVERDDVFVVGLGDGDNDKSIFEEADFSIGVNKEIGRFVDAAMQNGVESTKAVLRTLSKTSTVDLAVIAKEEDIKQQIKINAGIWFSMNDITRKILIREGWNL